MTTTELRLCGACLQTKAIADFRLRSRGSASRMKQCRACHNAAERERRSHIRQHQDDRRLNHLLAKAQGERSNKRLVALCNAMLDEFGGVQGFVESWRDFYRRSLAAGGLGAVRSFQAYLRLVRFCEHRN
ncbi:MAG TPA: hypothetical protein VMV10_01405 [Pirellulales bacterium]|nr:hypothetical protein [Pirellulales bacterium]